jgi:leishmanolysin
MKILSLFVSFLLLSFFLLCIQTTLFVFGHKHHHHHHDHEQQHGHNCIHDKEIIPLLNRHPVHTLPQFYKEGTLKHGTHGPPINVVHMHSKNKRDQETQIEYKEYSFHVRPVAEQSRDAEAQAEFVKANATNSAGIRFTVSTLDLYDSEKFCSYLGQITPDFKGNYYNCSEQDDIFTTAKRDALLNDLLPKALANITKLLHVVPLTRPIVGITSGVCPYFTVPQSHIDNGVSNTDYVLYVGAGKNPINNLAWAGMCASDNSGRPIIGRMNCGPAYIKYTTRDDVEKYISTITHELFHALGFSGDAINANFNIPGYTGASVLAGPFGVRGGLQVLKVTSPNVQAATRAYYNCPSEIGMELESEGGSGTAMSHFQRRNLFESVMSGVQGDINRIDNITLSLFADMQYYFPDLSYAEPMYYGNGTGCGFLNDACNSTTMGMKAQDLFCASTTQANPAVSMCTYNFFGIGKCGLGYFSGLPSYFSYYKDYPGLAGTTTLMQYCPFVAIYSNNKCRLGDLSDGTATDKVLGHTKGPGGRCIYGSSLITAGYVSPSPTEAPARCLIVTCIRQETPTGTTYRIKLGIRGTAVVTCPENGAAATNVAVPSGWSGSVNCPSAYDICPPSSKGWGDDLVYEVLPPITTSTIPTYTDVNGSTYTLAPTTTTTQLVTSTVSTTSTAQMASSTTTTAPVTSTAAADTTTTTTTDPHYQTFSISTSNKAKCDQVMTAALNQQTSLKNNLNTDIQKTVPSASVTAVTKMSDNCLSVTVYISNLAQLGSFNSLISNNDPAFLNYTANFLKTASGDVSISPAALSLGSSTLTMSTTVAPSTTSGNNSGSPLDDGPIPCFIDGPCYISYLVIGICAMVVIALVGYMFKKKGGDGEGGNAERNREKAKWNAEYGYQNERSADGPVLDHMSREMHSYQQRHARPAYNDL